MSRSGPYAGLFLLLCAHVALAAESTTPLPLGGLVVTRPADTTLQFDTADIHIDPSNVVAKYKITNTGPMPAAVTLGFPMPDLDFSDPDASYAIPASDPLNFVGLSVKIDGKPSPFSFTQSAVLGGRDVTAVLRRNKLALVPIGTFQSGLAVMPADQRQKLQDAGLIVENGADAQGAAIYSPSWTVRSSASRKANIAPGQAMAIELRYRTSVGMTLDTPLRQPLRTDKALAALVTQHRSDYCVDDGFYAGLDKLVAQPVPAPPPPPVPPPAPSFFQSAPPPPPPAAPEANVSRLRERTIVFSMQGPNPQGPYADFRLVVDKGRPDRVVSFCLNNLKRISPTAFEMRTANFTPENDLKVLLIGRN